MAALKPYFYKVHDEIPAVCEGTDIKRYIRNLPMHFRKAALGDIDPEAALPGGPLYYTDAPRNCHEGADGLYEMEDAVTTCLRVYDKKGEAKKKLAEMIVDRLIVDPAYRERLLEFNRVPQAWRGLLQPADPEEPLDRDKLVEVFATVQDRDFRKPNNAKGTRHPLARMLESRLFPETEKLAFVADYMIGRARADAAPWAVRIGSRGNYREYNLMSWLVENRAFILRTVGDIVRLKAHFSASNVLKRGALPELERLTPAMKIELK